MLVYVTGLTIATPVVELISSKGMAYLLAFTKVITGIDASKSGRPATLCRNIAFPPVRFAVGGAAMHVK